MIRPSPRPRYDRRLLGPGLVAWLYEYRNADLREHPGLASGLEIGVQLGGEWIHSGTQRETSAYEPGSIHRLDAGERFRYRFAAESATRPGVQVGFIVYPQAGDDAVGGEQELSLPADVGRRDARLLEMSRWLAERFRRGPTDEATFTEAGRELLAYVRRHAVLREPDPVLVAKRDIERKPEAELYVRHLADLAQMHPETFARAFRRRFGITPIRFRLETRLNRAAHLGWSRPDLTIADIAVQCGFNDLAFFHRSFRQQFGVTPIAHARRRIG
jgi:AraC-like DNA-binding protein